MTHWILYDAREHSRGFSLYEHSPGFPLQYKRAVSAFCGQVNSEENREDAVNFRYAPLEGRYLLSVIFRKPKGSVHSTRSTHRIVNFLMDGGDADRLFLLPFSQVSKWLTEQAELLLEDPENTLFPGLPQLNQRRKELRTASGQSTVDASELLSAASYCFQGAELSHQVFIGLPPSCKADQAFVEIEKLLSLLPISLRKYLSFQTAVFSASEARGIALNMASEQRIAALVHSGSPLGSETDKHIYYEDRALNPDREALLLYSKMEAFFSGLIYAPALLCALEDWNSYAALNRALHGKKGPAELFRKLDPKIWQRVLDYPLTPEILQEMKQHCPRSCKEIYGQISKKISDRKPPSSKAAPSLPAHSESKEPRKKTSPPVSGSQKPTKKPSFFTGLFLPCAGLLGGFAAVISAAAVFLKKLTDLQAAFEDTTLNLQISVSDGLALGKNFICFLLGIAVTVLTVLSIVVFKNRKK